MASSLISNPGSAATRSTFNRFYRERRPVTLLRGHFRTFMIHLNYVLIPNDTQWPEKCFYTVIGFCQPALHLHLRLEHTESTLVEIIRDANVTFCALFSLLQRAVSAFNMSLSVCWTGRDWSSSRASTFFMKASWCLWDAWASFWQLWSLFCRSWERFSCVDASTSSDSCREVLRIWFSLYKLSFFREIISNSWQKYSRLQYIQYNTV